MLDTCHQSCARADVEWQRQLSPPRLPWGGRPRVLRGRGRHTNLILWSPYLPPNVPAAPAPGEGARHRPRHQRAQRGVPTARGIGPNAALLN